MNNYILIDTNNNQSVTNTSLFRQYLDQPINIKSYIKINYLLISRTDYSIDVNNNTFTIIFNNPNNVNLTYNLVIPIGIYTNLTLATTITSLLNGLNSFSCVYN